MVGFRLIADICRLSIQSCIPDAGSGGYSPRTGSHDRFQKRSSRAPRGTGVSESPLSDWNADTG